MEEVELLLNRRWILKSEDKELYIRYGIPSEKSGNLPRRRWDARCSKTRFW